MSSSIDYRVLNGSEHPHPGGYRKLRLADSNEIITLTVLLRRKLTHIPLMPEYVVARPSPRPSRDAFALERGAEPKEMEAVVAYFRSEGLEILETDAARRTVIVRGPAAAISKAFEVELNEYEYARGAYRSHDGAVSLPASIADYVEAVVGLTNRKLHARHHSAATPPPAPAGADPLRAAPLTPAQVANLYRFPSGDGAGQTIGLFEMETPTGMAGYRPADIAATMAALGGLPVPHTIDVTVGGVGNSGCANCETGLDITIAGAIAPAATIAVYFTGGDAQSVLHALQKMVHPHPGEPVPSVISISYGWGPDDIGSSSFSPSEFSQFRKLFEDATTNKITVLASSGDTGACIESTAQAQTSYPASDIWVTACGGTLIGNVNGAEFDEWVWNDVGQAGHGATGGGVSARFAVPTYQTSVGVPLRNGTGKAGRGVPDIAGNASQNSGYLQVIGGSQPQPVGGTSAVAPLYAGLIARINAGFASPVGYLNTLLYSLPASSFRDIPGAPGPVNNDFGPVKGYAARPGWDPCTGLGSLNGESLQAALAAVQPSQYQETAQARPPVTSPVRRR